MANITNAQLFSFRNFAAGTMITCGNNRIVAHTLTDDGARRITASLHGHTVFTLRERPDNLATLDVDHCGYMTSTTIAAINDFLGAADIRARASRAGGTFSLYSRDIGRLEAKQGNEAMPINAEVDLVTGQLVRPMGWTFTAKAA